MWTWAVAITLILTSWVFFPEAYLEICRKILRWTRKVYEKRHGPEKTLKDLGAPDDLEL
jgi:hypothetical protein